MNVKYSPLFLKTLKKLDVRIRKSFRGKIVLFVKNPKDLGLNNHSLKRDYRGYRSIEVTADWRAIYKEIQEPDQENPTAYFVKIGTHNQLYAKKNPDSTIDQFNN